MAKGTKGSPLGGFDGTAALPNLQPFFQVSNRLFEAWMSVGTEILEFSKARMDQSLEMSRQISQTQSLNEAIDLQQKFARDLMQDCLSEANRLADLSTRGLIDSMSTLQRGTTNAAANFSSMAPAQAAE
jgi:phasin protein